MFWKEPAKRILEAAAVAMLAALANWAVDEAKNRFNTYRNAKALRNEGAKLEAMTDEVLFPKTHPGTILDEEFLQQMGVSVSKLATDTGIDQVRLQGIVSGTEGITADIAEGLSGFFGNSVQFWVNLQTHYDADTGKPARPADLLKEGTEGEGI